MLFDVPGQRPGSGVQVSGITGTTGTCLQEHDQVLELQPPELLAPPQQKRRQRVPAVSSRCAELRAFGGSRCRFEGAGLQVRVLALSVDMRKKYA